MQVLIVYATVEGQTRRIAERAAAIATDAGHAPRVIAVGPDMPPLEPDIGAILLCAPVHVGRYPQAFEAAVRAWADRLAFLPNALVSVSLAVLGGDAGGQDEAEAYVRTLAETTGWTPRRVHHAAGALRYSEYDYFKRWLMRMVARQKGFAGGEDREFTDWAALERFVRTFLTDAAA